MGANTRYALGIDCMAELSKDLKTLAEAMAMVGLIEGAAERVEGKNRSKRVLAALKGSRRNTIKTAKQVLPPKDYEQILELDRSLKVISLLVKN